MRPGTIASSAGNQDASDRPFGPQERPINAGGRDVHGLLYTLGTALIGHRYWTMKGMERVDSMDSFYKNLSIMGGFLLLYTAGAGKYSIDALCGTAAP